MSTDRRDTFKQLKQIVEETATHLEAVADKMDAMQSRDPDERLALLLKTYIAEQRSLVARLQEYVEDMDQEPAAREFAQFTMDVDPDNVTEPPESIDINSLTEWLLGENVRVTEFFRELSETATSEAAGEVLDSLVELMDGHDRRISKQSADTGDI